MNKQDFPEIETSNGIDRGLAATANDRIKKSRYRNKQLEIVSNFVQQTPQTNYLASFAM